MDLKKNLHDYCEHLASVKLKRWSDFPDFSIYSDQLLQLVNDELIDLYDAEESLMTKSMINNYVKWDIMTKPNKKKYDRLHIATAMVITILKPVMSITKIKEGIQLQIAIDGEENAYNAFCEAFENSLKRIVDSLENHKERFEFLSCEVPYNRLAISAITNALANKILTEKIISIEMERVKAETGEKMQKQTKKKLSEQEHEQEQKSELELLNEPELLNELEQENK